jgi:hypothetical protein
MGDYEYYAVTSLQHEVYMWSMRHNRYDDQIGYIACSHGWIKMVSVKPHAQNCGLATVFTELCLIDPDINENLWGNKAIQKIGIFDSQSDEVRDVIAHLKSRCALLVGLKMVASPLTGAYAYLSAAKRMGYQYMVVQFYDHARRRMGNSRKKETSCSQKFKYYEIETAQSLFDPESGNIEDPFEEFDPKGSTSGSGDEAKWYLCRELTLTTKIF